VFKRGAAPLPKTSPSLAKGGGLKGWVVKEKLLITRKIRNPAGPKFSENLTHH